MPKEARGDLKVRERERGKGKRPTATVVIRYILSSWSRSLESDLIRDNCESDIRLRQRIKNDAGLLQNEAHSAGQIPLRVAHSPAAIVGGKKNKTRLIVPSRYVVLSLFQPPKLTQSLHG